ASVAAPFGTSIVGGFVTLVPARADGGSFTVRVKTASTFQSVKNGATVYDAPAGTATGAVTVPLPAGSYGKARVVLQATQPVPATLVSDPAADGFAVTGATIVLHDLDGPQLYSPSSGAAALGDADGATVWHSGVVCVGPFTANDAGSGVTGISLL